MEVYVLYHLTNATNNRTLNYKHSVVPMVTISNPQTKEIKDCQGFDQLVF